jgi:hypothetical protein
MKIKLILVFASVIITTCNAYGMWNAPVELISGSWGDSNDQFGIERGDTIAYDLFPDSVCVGSDRIIIGDLGNGRKKIY